MKIAVLSDTHNLLRTEVEEIIRECDAVIHLRNGKYGLIEIKLGGDKLIEEGAKSLKSMEAKIDTDKMNAPSFLMVLTGTGDYAYRRQDGVCVVPIGCLKN